MPAPMRRSGWPKNIQAFPINYWDALTARTSTSSPGLKNGLHANLAETSAVLRINPDLVDMDRANAEFPPFPDYTIPTGGGAHGLLLHAIPGSVLLGDEVGHVGRCAEVHARSGRALHRGRRPLDAGAARQHREDVRGDAAALARPGARSSLPLLALARVPGPARLHSVRRGAGRSSAGASPTEVLASPDWPAWVGAARRGDPRAGWRAATKTRSSISGCTGRRSRSCRARPPSELATARARREKAEALLLQRLDDLVAGIRVAGRERAAAVRARVSRPARASTQRRPAGRDKAKAFLVNARERVIAENAVASGAPRSRDDSPRRRRRA